MLRKINMPTTFQPAVHAESPLAWPCASRRGRTQPAIAYVAAQYDGKIPLDQVASLCRLSTYQFCRVFKHEQGISFGQYLLHYRLDRACERLLVGDALAKEVAYSVGFNDLSYFTWAFKRQVGVCPSQYHPGLNHHLPQAQDRHNA
jgi:two-component system, response regulator YesN